MHLDICLIITKVQENTFSTRIVRGKQTVCNNEYSVESILHKRAIMSTVSAPSGLVLCCDFIVM